MKRSVRVFSERQAVWLLSLYPPLLFQRVRCVSMGPGFRTCRMVVPRSALTRNLNGTTFGGTIFSAADPVLPLMYWQIFAHEGTPVQVWLQAARADYTKPAASTLTLDFEITEQDVEDARAALHDDRRFRKPYRVEARDRSGDVCAVLTIEVYIRLPRPPQHAVSGF